MRVERLQADGPPADAAAQLRQLVFGGDWVEDAVKEIVVVVAHEGDVALHEYTLLFDTGGVPPPPLLVEQAELDEALKRLPLDVVAGLQVAIANVAEVAQAGVGNEATTVSLPQGQLVTVRELPVRSAAVYVPGGRAPYPSTAVMGVVAARAAGVLDVAVCSPPGPDGRVDPLILGTCRLLGVDRVYRMGGAQAIAALAYGTYTVARVDVIVGPGNIYVQEAKRQLAHIVGIDSYAGPSDLVVVLGEDTPPRLAALDLLAQAEHGAGSFVAALSPSPAVLDALAAELSALTGQPAVPEVEEGLEEEQWLEQEPKEEEEPPEEEPQLAETCALMQCHDMREAVAIADAFAPEHLQLMGAEAEALAPLVRSAGCLFVGAAAATAYGDYVAGSNHVLPTAGAARFASGLSPQHFRRRMAEVRLGEAGGETVRKLTAAGVPLARAEGFEWHARSMEARIGEAAAPPPGPEVGENGRT